MKKFLFLCSNLILTVLVCHSQDWANWRGPSYNGSSNTTESLPVEFDSTKNVKWKYELPGPSAGTPIVSGQFVFVSSIKVIDKSSG